MLHLGTFRGIPLYLHWSWFLLLLFFILTEGLITIAIVLVAFLMVVLHEYGHCYMAQKYGVHVQDVILYPVGGVARIGFNIGQAKEEIFIALAGPAVNLLLALIATIPAFAAYLLKEPITLLISVVFLSLNLFIALFNLLPIFPMDGGRVLRGVLSLILGEHGKATRIAVRISQALCVVGVVAGLVLVNPMMVVIFFLISVGAQHELIATTQNLCVQRIIDKLAEGLGRPELKTASLPQVIATLEEVKNDEIRQSFYYDELVPLLKDLEEMG